MHHHASSNDDILAELVHLALSMMVVTSNALAVILVITAAAISYRSFRHYWRGGLITGLVLGLLTLLVLLFDLWHFDPAQALEAELGYNDPFAHNVAWAVKIIMTLVMPLWTVIYVMIAYVAGRGLWQKCRQLNHAPPHQPMLGIWLGLVLGILFGGISSLVFYLADVGVHPYFEQLKLVYPDLDDVPVAMLLCIAMLYVSIAAVQEELVYRGAMQGLLTRWAGSTMPGLLLVNLGIALLFTAAHLLNTDSPFIKSTQIFLFAIGLAWLAHRFGLRSATAAHLSMNLTVTPIEVLS